MPNRHAHITRMTRPLDELNITMGKLKASAQEVKEEAHGKYKMEIASSVSDRNCKTVSWPRANFFNTF